MKFIRAFNHDGYECLVPASRVTQISKMSNDIVFFGDGQINDNFEMNYADESFRDEAFDELEKMLNS